MLVWFGAASAPATVTDDSHLTAIAPTGSGTVDVRVQSGAGNADFPANVTSPVWGYGLSATSTVARFTFDGSNLDAFHAWLASYGLPSDGSADYLDSDGDGMSNWQEFVAGTNPTNSASVFRILSGTPLPGAGFVLHWSSESNRFYDLSRAANLAAGTNAFVRLLGGSNLPATPPENSYTDAVSWGPGLLLYRADVHR